MTDSPRCDELVKTPVTAESLANLRKLIERNAHEPASSQQYYVQKLANAAERVFAERTLLLDEKSLLFDQNNEKKCRQLIGSRVTGTAKVMTYEDIVEAERRRDIRATASSSPKRKKRSQNGKQAGSAEREKEITILEIRESGLHDFCSVIQL